jgi:hypothetical protein
MSDRERYLAAATHDPFGRAAVSIPRPLAVISTAIVGCTLALLLAARHLSPQAIAYFAIGCALALVSLSRI